MVRTFGAPAYREAPWPDPEPEARGAPDAHAGARVWRSQGDKQRPDRGTRRGSCLGSRVRATQTADAGQPRPAPGRCRAGAQRAPRRRRTHGPRVVCRAGLRERRGIPDVRRILDLRPLAGQRW